MWSEVCDRYYDKYYDNTHSGNNTKKKQHKYKPKHAKSWIETGFIARIGRWFINWLERFNLC